MMKVLTFGEMLMRLKAPNNQRIMQAQAFEASYGGAEANVAVSLGLLGDQVAYLTRLPENLLGRNGQQTLRQYGVDTTKIQFTDGRLGYISLKKGPVFVRLTLFMTALIVPFHWPSQLNLIGPVFLKALIISIFQGLRQQFQLNWRKQPKKLVNIAKPIKFQ